jgi:hypothetical protein
VTPAPPARTPIARVPYSWTEATGHDELLLLERDAGLATAVALVGRRAVQPSGDPLDASALPIGDVDALLAELRANVLGDRLIAEGRCPACDCAVDIDFSLAAFREHRAPERPRGATPAERPGWWRLRRYAVEFRPPTARDVLAAQDADDPTASIAAACIHSVGADGETAVPRSALAASERAMARLAPTLRDDVEGTCPDCGVVVALDVDVRELCLAELRFLSHGVLEDVHLLAGAYGWAELAILDLPTARRTAYVEMIRASRGAPVSAEAFGA